MWAGLYLSAGARTEIDHLQGLTYVEFAWFAIGIAAIVVVEAVGEVRIFLHFTNHHVWANGVRHSRWNKEGVARMNLVR